MEIGGLLRQRPFRCLKPTTWGTNFDFYVEKNIKALVLLLTHTNIIRFEQMTECLRWCTEFGVLEATFYAFSIENFKRSDEEKEFLFGLLKRKIEDMLEDENM